MRSLLLVAALIAVIASAWAEEPAGPGGVKLRYLKAPKGVTLGPDEQVLLDQANEAIERGYRLLVEGHDPGKAVLELRKALAIRNKLQELKPEKQSAGKGYTSPLPGTPADEIDTAGGIETILEIAESGGMSAAPEVDSGLHKRKIIKSAEEEARKLQARQEQLTQDLQAAATAGGGGGGDPQQRQPQQQQAAGQPGQQQPAGGGSESRPAPGQQQPGQQQGQPQPGAADPQAAALGGRQQEIAGELNRIAAQLDQAGGNDTQTDRAAQGFRQAAAQAGRTAQQIRQGDLAGAATASRQVERAIRAALAEAGMAGTATLGEALAAVEGQIGRLQARQQEILAQTQQIAQGPGGGRASDRTQRERARGLAGEQARLKPQVENLQGAIDDLAASTGSPNPAARTAQNAAREELGAAAQALRNARPNQAVVNAAVRLGQGETQAAAAAMAQVQSALAAARERVAAADGALASGDAARLERALRSVRQMAGEARQLERTAVAAAGLGQQQAGGQPGAEQKGGEPGKQQDGPPRPAAAGAEPFPGEQGQVSPSWGQVLNRSAEQIGQEVTRTVGRLRLPNILPGPSQQLVKAASQTTSFERDFGSSLSKVRSLLAALETVEVELQRRVGREAENKALRDYSKEKIPGTYRKAVADYYEELAKGAE